MQLANVFQALIQTYVHVECFISEKWTWYFWNSNNSGSIFATWNGISKFFLYEDMLYLLFGKQYANFKSCESSCDHRLGGNGFYMEELENKGNACYITYVTNQLWLSNYAMIWEFLSDLLIHFLQSIAKIGITKETIIYFKHSNYMIGNVCYILKWPFGFWLKNPF